MFKFFSDLLKALNPRISDTPEQIFAWRQTVAFSLVLLTLVSIFDVSRGFGWMEWAGVPGYVNLAQLAPLQQLAKDAREDQLIAEILDNVRRYCLATDAGDVSGQAFAFQKLQEARTKYFRLTSREYPQLMCSMSAQPASPAKPTP